MAKTNVIILSLGFSNLVTGFPQLITSLLLIEIGLSFGVASQIKTVAFVVSVIMGLCVIGGLSVKVRYKVLGILAILGALIFHFFTINPAKETSS